MENEKNNPQVESRYAEFMAVKVLLKNGLINQETFDNIVKNEFPEFKTEILVKGVRDVKSEL